ncbi:SMI1/KNR4 family protein [Aeoliella sp. ICT_H6.2]|uniref:SMI1/KNR4 family protein n=1 Tax=Aeoliella straminimaris TaxID=2954799 RepID=A0A9X2FEP7_9BACT|nr:SMI1/KNR4 family protein [Aeoliella straminimaris]MCO6044421.1 SMI1/KNR4 family protein [Aeoliella straminimaris]
MNIKPTPETIWTRPAYLPYVQTPLTEALIRQTESQLGHTLPQLFLDILRVQNGGPIRFSIPDSVGDQIAGIGPSYPSITDDTFRDHQEYVDYPLDGLIPFDGDGHWYHCLDYREGSAEPAVSYIDVECNSQGRIADSFSDFLQLMELDVENERVLQNVENIHDAQRRLEALFGLAFERKLSNIGVPYLKLQTGKKWDECFWISSNRVAAGYSGDDPETMEFEGDALLFPELPADTVIFEAPDEYLDQYGTRLQDSGLALVDVHTAANAT